jgi:hypothetical protein
MLITGWGSNDQNLLRNRSEIFRTTLVFIGLTHRFSKKGMGRGDR